MMRAARPVRIEGDAAFLPLTQGYVATLDAADVGMVDKWCWCVSATAEHRYGARSIRAGGVNKKILLHRAIIEAPDDLFVDHIDGDGLNNRRSNLRLCSHRENMRNRVMDRANEAGAKGVWLDKEGYRASIQMDGKTTHLGTYDTVREASAAYAGAAAILFGKFARR